MIETMYVVQYGIDEINFIIEYLKWCYPRFHLSQLTNGLMSDSLQVNSVYPLALVYEQVLNSEGDLDFKSILPAVGVELVTDTDFKDTLGYNKGPFKVNENFLKELENTTLADRNLKASTVLSDTNLKLIRSNFDKMQADNKYYAGTKTESINQDLIRISIWCDNVDVKNLIFKITRALLKNLKITKGSILLNLNIKAQADMYDLNTGRILYGAQFELSFQNYIRTIELPYKTEDILLLEKAEAHFYRDEQEQNNERAKKSALIFDDKGE